MKRYNVKQVIKMEDRLKKLSQLGYSGDGELYFMPLMLLTTLGVSGLIEPSLRSQLLPLIMSSGFTIFGVGNIVRLFSAGLRSDLLYDKINNVYDVMGDDFKKQVEQERLRQEQEEYGRSR